MIGFKKSPLLFFQETYLIKNYAITIDYKNQPKSKSKNDTTIKNMLLVGVHMAHNQFAKLPDVKKELRLVNQLFDKRGNVQLLENENATKENIFEALEQTDILHIASHGLFKHNNPTETGICLIDETLSIQDISKTDKFKKVKHVTLSSCWGADHFIIPGRWVISLPETLIRSGVKSILGCFWEVDDEFATEFMVRYYNIYLLNTKISLYKRP